MNKKYATYLRVSTQKQGSGGLGIEAQRNMCANFIQQHNGEHVCEFMDVESGTHRNRKGLWAAIDYCKKNGTSLVIAKLDRLARDVEFTFSIMNTGIDIHFTDMPIVNSMVLGVFASVAQYERELIAKRTKDALAVKKAQGCKLGAASEKYIETQNRKSKEEKAVDCEKRGKSKSTHYQGTKDVQAFIRIIKNVFPDACVNEDMKEWDWKAINTRGDNKKRIAMYIRDYKALDDTGTLFSKWDISAWDDNKIQVRIASEIKSIRRSYGFKRSLY